MAKKKLYNSSGIVYSTDNNFRNTNEEETGDSLLPAEQKLKVVLDKKHRAGKIVTLVSGFAMKEKEIESIAKQLKAFCGSGGSFNDNEVIIQGDHREKIVQWLRQKGYSKTLKI